MPGMASSKRNSFLRPVAVLASGTVIGHLIALAAFPLLTRLYSPDNFSDLAVFVAIVTTLSTVACFRFDIAIPLPVRRVDALSLVILSIASATLVAGLLLVLTVWMGDGLAELLGAPAIANYLWLAPISIWLAAIYNALQFFATREKAFSQVARTRVARSISAVVVQLGIGTVSSGPFGLVAGHSVSSGAGIGTLLRGRLGKSLMRARRVGFVRARSVIQKFIRFPLLSAPEALANVGSIQLPIIVIAASSSGSQAGFLMLAMKLMQAPMALLGTSVAQVYLGAAPGHLRSGTLAEFTLTTFSSLIKFGVGPILAAAVMAPAVFPVVFGQQWSEAGVLMLWMAPWFALQFVTSPLAMALHITHNQVAALCLQVGGLILRVGAVVAAIAFANGLVAEIYAVSGAAFYAAYLLLVMRKVGVSLFDVVRSGYRGAPIILLWLLLALLVNKIWSFMS